MCILTDLSQFQSFVTVLKTMDLYARPFHDPEVYKICFISRQTCHFFPPHLSLLKEQENLVVPDVWLEHSGCVGTLDGLIHAGIRTHQPVPEGHCGLIEPFSYGHC